MSFRSECHNEMLTSDAPLRRFSGGEASVSDSSCCTEADVELEGVTADGGLAVRVGFDTSPHSELLSDEEPACLDEVAHCNMSPA